jgi:hypothetical protein
LGQYKAGFRHDGKDMAKNIRVRLQVMAVNMLTPTPNAKVRANPLTNPEPNQNKAAHAIQVVTLLSKMLENAR